MTVKSKIWRVLWKATRTVVIYLHPLYRSNFFKYIKVNMRLINTHQKFM